MLMKAPAPMANSPSARPSSETILRGRGGQGTVGVILASTAVRRCPGQPAASHLGRAMTPAPTMVLAKLKMDSDSEHPSSALRSSTTMNPSLDSELRARRGGCRASGEAPWRWGADAGRTT